MILEYFKRALSIGSCLFRRGAVGFSVCGFGQYFWFGFSVFALKNCGFSVGLRVFSNLAFGFRFLSVMMVVFRILLPIHFTVFMILSRKSHLEVTLKLQFQRTTYSKRNA